MAPDEVTRRLAEIRERREEALKNAMNTHLQAVLIVDDVPWMLGLIESREDGTDGHCALVDCASRAGAAGHTPAGHLRD